MQEVFIPAPGVTNQVVLRAISDANKNIEIILTKLEQKGSFLYTDVSGAYISKKGRESIKRGEKMEVHIYTSRNPFSPAIGYYDYNYPNRIYMNSRKLYKIGKRIRSNGHRAGTLVHEWIHFLSFMDMVKSFDHGSNRWTPEKEDSAPYYADNIAEIIIDNKPNSPEPRKVGDNSRIKRRPRRRWYKPWTWF